MITQWSLQNFKAVRSADLRLRPLTIISGTNSSGKSTVVQSMAVVAQTLAAQLETDRMVLNGHLMTLGAYSALTSLGGTADLVVGWQMTPQDAQMIPDGELASAAVTYDSRGSVGLDNIACTVTFTPHELNSNRPRVKSGFLEVSPDRSQSPDAPKNSITWQFAITRDRTSPERYIAKLDPYALAELEKRHPCGRVDSCELRHFLPSRMLLEVDTNADISLARAQALCQERRFYRPENNPILVDNVPKDVLDVIAPILGDSLADSAWTFAGLTARIAISAQSDSTLLAKLAAARPIVCETLRHLLGGAKFEPQHTYLPGRLPDAVSYVESFFATKFHYLGPLRDEPRGVYPYPARLGPLDLGRRGEFTAAAYHAYADSPVDHAERDELERLGPFAPTTRASLRHAVNDWLRYFDVVKEGITTQEERYGHVLMVDSSWELIHVGTGVSQLLPIVVLGLLSQPDDFLVIEHPELHLHPYVQARVADFFLFLALSGRQVVVETHSEHVINRLRTRIAQDQTDGLKDSVAIHFAELKNGVTSIREVAVSEFGAISEWPRGFFDEAANEAEAMIRAAIQRHDDKGTE